MKLTSADGVVVDLRPLRYQFGSSAEPRDWDANWLVVAGHVELTDGRSWSFTDPCLTTWEARELGSWLHGVREGTVAPTAFFGQEDDVSLVFTEPNVAFSLAGRSAGVAAVRVHLSLGSLPPWLGEAEGLDLFEFFVVAQLTHAALTDAEAAWEQELAAFPVR
jgi:hypothetical protein